MAALTFSDVKIEKQLGIPEIVVPNRFYLIETGGTVRFYLSDSKGTLHLLNEGYIKDINVNKTSDYSVEIVDENTVFHTINSGNPVMFYLPPPEENFQLSFFTHNDIVRVSTTGPEQVYLGDVLVDINEAIESAYPGSFICLRAIDGYWVARYLTGQWDVVTIEYIDGMDALSEFIQTIDGGNSISEYTDEVDGGGA